MARKIFESRKKNIKFTKNIIIIIKNVSQREILGKYRERRKLLFQLLCYYSKDLEERNKRKKNTLLSKRRERGREKRERETRGTVADEERGLTMPQILVPAVECPRAHTTHN